MSNTPGPWTVAKWDEVDHDIEIPDMMGGCFILSPIADIAYLALNKTGDEDLTAPDAYLLASAPLLQSALQGMVDMYVELVNSGDCGNWNPEDVAEVLAARNALAQSRRK